MLLLNDMRVAYSEQHLNQYALKMGCEDWKEVWISFFYFSCDDMSNFWHTKWFYCLHQTAF